MLLASLEDAYNGSILGSEIIKIGPGQKVATFIGFDCKAEFVNGVVVFTAVVFIPVAVFFKLRLAA